MLIRRPFLLMVMALVLLILVLPVACGRGVEEEPTAEEPAVEGEPVVEEPAVVEELAAEQAATEQAATEQAATEQAVTEQAVTEQAATEQAVTEQAVTEDLPVTVFDFGFGGEPDLCDPADPALTEVQEFQIGETDSTILDGESSLFVDYINGNGQTFRITVDSIDQEASRAYLEQLAVCFEAVPAGAPSGIEASSFRLSDPLIDVLVESMGRSLAELQDLRAVFLAASSGSLDDLLTDNGVDPDAVLDEAVKRAGDEIDAAVEAGLMPEPEAEDLQQRLASIYRDWIFADETIAIIDSNQEELSDFPEELEADPETIVVTVDWTDLEVEERSDYAIFYVIDPPLGQYRRHWYYWKYRSYVKAYIKVKEGRVSLGMWRWDGCYQSVGYTTASAVSYTWPPLEQSSNTPHNYRLHTYGRDSSNDYNMYGSWRYAAYTGDIVIHRC